MFPLCIFRVCFRKLFLLCQLFTHCFLVSIISPDASIFMFQHNVATFFLSAASKSLLSIYVVLWITREKPLFVTQHSLFPNTKVLHILFLFIFHFFRSKWKIHEKKFNFFILENFFNFLTFVYYFVPPSPRNHIAIVCYLQKKKNTFHFSGIFIFVECLFMYQFFLRKPTEK